MRSLLQPLIRNATVTAAAPSLRLDAFILHAAELLPFEEVEIVVASTGGASAPGSKRRRTGAAK